MLADLMYIRNVAEHLYGNRPSYAGMNNQIIIDYGQVPARMVWGSELRNVFNHGVTVSPVLIGGHADRGLSIRFDGIPYDVCILVAKLNPEGALHSLEVEGSGGSFLFGHDGIPPPPSQLTTACGEAAADITWVFR